MTNIIEAAELKIKELKESLKRLDYYNGEYRNVEYKIKEAEENLLEIKQEIRELGDYQQTPPKKKKSKTQVKKEKAKKERRDEKLKRALEAGGLVAERSLSKIAWDIAHNKVRVVSGKLDYRSWQILNCAADKIAQNEWMPNILNLVNYRKGLSVDNERKMVFISAKEFKDYIGDQNISNNNIIKMFEELPKAVLKGKVKIPIYYPKYKWLIMKFYEDNICGIAIAYDEEGFEEYRSKRRLRGEGSGKEEPVFILLFSNAYGNAFFRHAQKREACQLINQKLYKLNPNAQELFQAIRWNEKGPIIINVEEISRAVGWNWPAKNISLRVKKCQKLIDILYKKNFINKPIPRGLKGKVKYRSWFFYISKGRGEERIKPIFTPIIKNRI